jgi:hypothetical protein
MKKTTLMLSVAAALIALGTSCQKEKQLADRAVTAGTISPCSDSLGRATLSGVISGTRNLSNDTVYYLSGLVYVTGTINIEEGTLIRGNAGVSGNPGGGLIVTKTGFIDARGTASCPIVFTSYRNYQGAQSGDWSGVVILGEAPTNRPTTTIVEGITGTPPANATYGGSLPGDNSGYLEYVRIEYAGYELATDNELNGLTLAGVGSGTTINHVEVFKSKDDAFEFFGGTVNPSYLVAVDPLDDMFDFDNGYIGTVEYALGISDLTRADKSQSNGIECDNIANGDSLATPITKPVLRYFTIVGVPDAATANIVYAPANGKYGRAAHFRRSAQFDVSSSVFLGFNNGIAIDSAASSPFPYGNTPYKFISGVSTLNTNLVHAFVRPYLFERNGLFYGISTPAGNFGYTASTPNSSIGLVSPFNRSSIANFYADGFGAANSNSAGALLSGDTWANTWTRLQ